MTYCVAMNLERGLIFASDSRTNAGVDQVAKFSKMHVFEREDDRLIVALSSGNLSITQNTLNVLRRRARAKKGNGGVWAAKSLYQVAGLFGAALREVLQRDGPYLQQHKIDASGSFIIGGQISGEPPRLFSLYSQGNFIESSRETPYFQIGEIKYGKPIIDRVIKPETDLIEAAKCTLVSFDSTMRSNLSVGPPIELLLYKRDSLRVGLRQLILEDDDYFEMIHKKWGDGLRRVFTELPIPTWFD